MTSPLELVVPLHDPNQSLRLRRFLLAALVYGVAIGLMGLYVVLGFMTLGGWQITTAAILAVNGVIYTVLRSGRNERLRDPSLTGVQMFCTCLLMALTMYQVDSARGALLLLYLVLLMFGVLRLRQWQFMALGLFALVCYAAAIAAVWQTRPWAVNMDVELLQLAAMATLVPCGGFFAGYVGGLRRKLRDRHIALQQAREQAHDLRVLDPLTAVSNRSRIIEFLQYEVARAARLEQPLSVIMLDLDRFKRINRQYGHPVGDEVLRRVAERLQGAMRSIDGLGRYGGEEFLVVLPDTPLAEASVFAERLRDRVEGCRFASLPPTFKLSVSVGLAEFRHGDGVWSLIERARGAADHALDAGGGRIDATEGS